MEREKESSDRRRDGGDEKPFGPTIETFTADLTTSAMRRSRSVPAAVCTAVFAASSQDCALVPITSVTL